MAVALEILRLAHGGLNEPDIVVTRIKRAYRQFANDPPGKLFANLHRRWHARPKGLMLSLTMLALGLVLIVVGLLMGLIPGVPGIVFAIVGCALIITRFRRASDEVDRLELRVRKVNPFGAFLRWLRSFSHRRYLATLAVLFGIIWVGLGIAPHDRGTWLLENFPVILFVVAVAVFHRSLLLSRISYTLIFLFLCAHEIGAHFTYGKVPYDEVFQSVFGVRFNDLVGWERNNFDRIVHFSYGLLLAYPIREIFLRIANARGFWGYFLPLDLTMSSSMFFELLEWAVAVVFGSGSTDYLGTQGDPWDAHKDMALASLGALLAMTINAFINWRFQRDFAREWGESLRVKQPAPLGEDEAARMIRNEGRPGAS